MERKLQDFAKYVRESFELLWVWIGGDGRRSNVISRGIDVSFLWGWVHLHGHGEGLIEGKKDPRYLKRLLGFENEYDK